MPSSYWALVGNSKDQFSQVAAHTETCHEEHAKSKTSRLISVFVSGHLDSKKNPSSVGQDLNKLLKSTRSHTYR